jgi:thiol-disulfide isomerase/thioredoxin
MGVKCTSTQLFNCQLELERNLKSINNDLNANQNESQTIIYQYLDHILEHNLITIQDFGNDLEWLNVERCLSLHNDLKGSLLVIDFFTYCCINCLHVLPQLNAIDKLYQNEGLLVLGIHSPKFDNEKDVTNVGDAILKYDISHPVANDPLGKLWTSLSVQCWPTLVILGPNSQILFTLIGENGIQEWLQLYTKTALNYFKLKNIIITENKFKIAIKLLRNQLKSELLEFPGKISASSDQQLLAISDFYGVQSI